MSAVSIQKSCYCTASFLRRKWTNKYKQDWIDFSGQENNGSLANFYHHENDKCSSSRIRLSCDRKVGSYSSPTLSDTILDKDKCLNVGNVPCVNGKIRRQGHIGTGLYKEEAEHLVHHLFYHSPPQSRSIFVMPFSIEVSSSSSSSSPQPLLPSTSPSSSLPSQQQLSEPFPHVLSSTPTHSALPPPQTSSSSSLSSSSSSYKTTTPIPRQQPLHYNTNTSTKNTNNHDSSSILYNLDDCPAPVKMSSPARSPITLKLKSKNQKILNTKKKTSSSHNPIETIPITTFAHTPSEHPTPLSTLPQTQSQFSNQNPSQHTPQMTIPSLITSRNSSHALQPQPRPPHSSSSSLSSSSSSSSLPPSSSLTPAVHCYNDDFDSHSHISYFNFNETPPLTRPDISTFNLTDNASGSHIVDVHSQMVFHPMSSTSSLGRRNTATSGTEIYQSTVWETNTNAYHTNSDTFVSSTSTTTAHTSLMNIRPKPHINPAKIGAISSLMRNSTISPWITSTSTEQPVTSYLSSSAAATVHNLPSYDPYYSMNMTTHLAAAASMGEGNNITNHSNTMGQYVANVQNTAACMPSSMNTHHTVKNYREGSNIPPSVAYNISNHPSNTPSPLATRLQTIPSYTNVPPSMDVHHRSLYSTGGGRTMPSLMACNPANGQDASSFDYSMNTTHTAAAANNSNGTNITNHSNTMSHSMSNHSTSVCNRGKINVARSVAGNPIAKYSDTSNCVYPQVHNVHNTNTPIRQQSVVSSRKMTPKLLNSRPVTHNHKSFSKNGPMLKTIPTSTAVRQSHANLLSVEISVSTPMGAVDQDSAPTTAIESIRSSSPPLQSSSKSSAKMTPKITPKSDLINHFKTPPKKVSAPNKESPKISHSIPPKEPSNLHTPQTSSLTSNTMAKKTSAISSSSCNIDTSSSSSVQPPLFSKSAIPSSTSSVNVQSKFKEKVASTVTKVIKSVKSMAAKITSETKSSSTNGPKSTSNDTKAPMSPQAPNQGSSKYTKKVSQPPHPKPTPKPSPSKPTPVSNSSKTSNSSQQLNSINSTTTSLAPSSESLPISTDAATNSISTSTSNSKPPSPSTTTKVIKSTVTKISSSTVVSTNTKPSNITDLSRVLSSTSTLKSTPSKTISVSKGDSQLSSKTRGASSSASALSSSSSTTTSSSSASSSSATSTLSSSSQRSENIKGARKVYLVEGEDTKISVSCPVRGKDSDDKARERRDRRVHPYNRPTETDNKNNKSKEYATFDLAYRDLTELMECMTNCAFRGVRKKKENSIKGGRFRGYKFVRSKVVRTEPELELVHHPLKEEIEDFEERERLADEVEKLMETSMNTLGEKFSIDAISQHYQEKAVAPEDEGDYQVESAESLNSIEPGSSVEDCRALNKTEDEFIVLSTTGYDSTLVLEKDVSVIEVTAEMRVESDRSKNQEEDVSVMELQVSKRDEGGEKNQEEDVSVLKVQVSKREEGGEKNQEEDASVMKVQVSKREEGGEKNQEEDASVMKVQVSKREEGGEKNQNCSIIIISDTDDSILNECKNESKSMALRSQDENVIKSDTNDLNAEEVRNSSESNKFKVDSDCELSDLEEMRRKILTKMDRSSSQESGMNFHDTEEISTHTESNKINVDSDCELSSLERMKHKILSEIDQVTVQRSENLSMPKFNMKEHVSEMSKKLKLDELVVISDNDDSLVIAENDIVYTGSDLLYKVGAKSDISSIEKSGDECSDSCQNDLALESEDIIELLDQTIVALGDDEPNGKDNRNSTMIEASENMPDFFGSGPSIQSKLLEVETKEESAQSPLNDLRHFIKEQRKRRNILQDVDTKSVKRECNYNVIEKECSKEEMNCLSENILRNNELISPTTSNCEIENQQRARTSPSFQRAEQITNALIAGNEEEKSEIVLPDEDYEINNEMLTSEEEDTLLADEEELDHNSEGKKIEHLSVDTEVRLLALRQSNSDCDAIKEENQFGDKQATDGVVVSDSHIVQTYLIRGKVDSHSQNATSNVVIMKPGKNEERQQQISGDATFYEKRDDNDIVCSKSDDQLLQSSEEEKGFSDSEASIKKPRKPDGSKDVLENTTETVGIRDVSTRKMRDEEDTGNTNENVTNQRECANGNKNKEDKIDINPKRKRKQEENSMCGSGAETKKTRKLTVESVLNTEDITNMEENVDAEETKKSRKPDNLFELPDQVGMMKDEDVALKGDSKHSGDNKKDVLDIQEVDLLGKNDGGDRGSVESELEYLLSEFNEEDGHKDNECCYSLDDMQDNQMNRRDTGRHNSGESSNGASSVSTLKFNDEEQILLSNQDVEVEGCVDFSAVVDLLSTGKGNTFKVKGVIKDDLIVVENNQSQKGSRSGSPVSSPIHDFHKNVPKQSLSSNEDDTTHNYNNQDKETNYKENNQNTQGAKQDSTSAVKSKSSNSRSPHTNSNTKESTTDLVGGRNLSVITNICSVILGEKGTVGDEKEEDIGKSKYSSQPTEMDGNVSNKITSDTKTLSVNSHVPLKAKKRSEDSGCHTGEENCSTVAKRLKLNLGNKC